jgi:hypothetical protein
MKGRLTGWVLLAAAVVLSAAGCSKQSNPGSGGGATNPSLLIVPHVSVGPIHSGMTVAQVLKELGEPQRRTGNALEYTRLGFAVVPGPQGLVQVVMCGDVMGANRPVAKAFTGRTEAGIGINSSREQLIKVYGEPSKSQNFPGGTEGLTYDSLGITFTLEAGKVYHMIVRLDGPGEVDRTVHLDMAPTARESTN